MKQAEIGIITLNPKKLRFRFLEGDEIFTFEVQIGTVVDRDKWTKAAPQWFWQTSDICQQSLEKFLRP